MIDEDDTSDIMIGFHRPLSTSIEHLHMHAFKLPFKSRWTKFRKYNPMFFVTIDNVIKGLN